MPHLNPSKGKVPVQESPCSSVSRAAKVPPPETPHRRAQPPHFPSTPQTRAGPSTAPIPCTPVSSTLNRKRKEQSLITSFFPNKKVRVETVPIAPSPAESKAARLARKQEEEDIKALIQDIEKEEREERKAREDAAKAAREAERQLKREAREAEALRRKQVNRCRNKWRDWVSSNKKPLATFSIADGELWSLHRNVKQCRAEFGLPRTDLDCLPHCDVENPLNGEYADMRMFRLVDVERLAWRKEGVLRGVEGSEEEVIEQGRRLWEEKRKEIEANAE